MEEKKDKIEKLKRQIARCRRCVLNKTRTNTVPGEGSADARIMFIGEAPGQSEDEQGRPFVGRAGHILDQLLESIDLKREDVYICNILKCRPPSNRNPLSDEIRACAGALDRQIKVIDPVIIATLGSFATTTIFEKFGLAPAKISAVHGKVFDTQTPFGPKKIIPLFHPAVATYDASKLDLLKKDFRIFQNILQEECAHHD
ncbi:MAG: uracil-DNA glycosylase [Candidatus Omnitrophota bacterium]